MATETPVDLVTKTWAGHESTQGVHDVCEHINDQHRAAKEASSRSQELFFSLYFRDRPTIDPVVVGVRSPEYNQEPAAGCLAERRIVAPPAV